MTILATIAAAEPRCHGSKLKHLAAACGLSVDDLLPYWPRVQADRAKRRERAAAKGQDGLIRLAATRPFRAAALRSRKAEAAEIAAVLSLPMAAHWRADRRAAVAAASSPEQAKKLARAATMEAVVRLATSKACGFACRHTSKSRVGTASSRYLRHVSGARPGALLGHEIRISDHVVPVYGEREARYDERGGPRWSEIIVDDEAMTWSPTRWRRELILRAAGRR